jgi:hypothetical protein
MNRRTKIVAFAGRKQSGKTTCSESTLAYFKYLGGESGKIYNFADPLKQDICVNILGLSHQQCYGEDSDKNTMTDIVWEGKNLTAREVMQFVGTDLFRKMKNDVWTSATLNKINNEKPALAIIADCRFPNEVDAVHAAGGLVIKLTRNPYDSNHDSETALDPIHYPPSMFDVIIPNDKMDIPGQLELVLAFLQDKGVFVL